MIFSTEQEQIAQFPLDSSLFLQGNAGCGKTTVGLARLQFLLQSGIPANEILILVPQRTLGAVYLKALADPDLPPGGQVDLVTMGGLAQRMTSLFWQLAATSAGFTHPEKPPIFLTLETAQYYMARIVDPLLAQGYFENIHIDRGRLISQILDNLNKAAAMGFSHLEIGERLVSSLISDPSQKHGFLHVQECATRFRQNCLQNQLLDFSLQLEMLSQHLWKSFLFQKYLHHRYHHLIFDNVEEDIPVAHDLIREWLPHFNSALLIHDLDGGFRQFLGADPISAATLKDSCKETATLHESFVAPAGLSRVQHSLEASILHKEPQSPPDLHEWMVESHAPFFPDMIRQICDKVDHLIHNEQIPPAEIVILSPFLSDSLLFSLSNGLEKLGIISHTIRPSRSLRDEPAVQCLFTLAALAHPQWGIPVTKADFSTTLMTSVENLDPIRAYFIAQISLRGKNGHDISSFDLINPQAQQRITFSIGNRFEELRKWIMTYQQRQPDPLDVFFSRLFGEILSRSGFGFHRDHNATAAAARLIESIQKFRRAINPVTFSTPGEFEKEYIQMIQSGILAALSLPAWDVMDKDSVLISPAHTFLMTNQSVKIQFWLDIGSRGWSERLYQPLTHPVVLSRNWQTSRKWTDEHELEYNRLILFRLTAGLIRRCSQQIYVYAVGMDEQGNEQRGDLLLAISSLLQKQRAMEGHHV